jgi:16S rRNA U516 pseudouridylate synthase RsuA-like enzyme
MGSVSLGRLRPGEWRDLTPAEVRALTRTASHDAD